LAVEHLKNLKALPSPVNIGVVSADLLNLGEKIKKIEASAAKLLHFDIKEV
jgi:pentose-5-phosphate-3-epimerase